MRSRWWIVALVIASVVMVRAARAEITARLLAPSASREGGWETVVVGFRWPESADSDESGAAVVTLQDARGGPVVARTVGGNTNSFRRAGETVEVLVPFPLVAVSELPRGQWRVRAGVEVGGRLVDGGDVFISRMEGGGDAFRVLTPVGGGNGTSGSDAQPLWSRVTDKALVAVAAGREDLLTGSPLLFAGCDAVLVTPALRGELTAARAVALMNVGVQLVMVGDGPKGELAHLVWDRVLPGGGTTTQVGAAGTQGSIATWVCPAEAFRRPAVIEAGLEHLAGTRLESPIGVRWVVWLVGPAAIAIVVLARGIFRRPRVILGVLFVAMASLGGAAVLALKVAASGFGASDGVVNRGWEVTVAPREQAAAAYTQAETLGRVRPLFAREVHLSEPADTLLYPVAASARDYFALAGVRVTLESPSTRGPERLSRLDLDVPARQEVGWLSRRLHLGVEGTEAMVMPPLPRNSDERERFARTTGIDLEKGAWVEGGYVEPAAGHSRELFTTWARRQTGIAAGAAAWYELRFDAGRTYFCRDGGKSAEQVQDARVAPLRVIDFGAAAAGVP